MVCNGNVQTASCVISIVCTNIMSLWRVHRLWSSCYGSEDRSQWSWCYGVVLYALCSTAAAYV